MAEPQWEDVPGAPNVAAPAQPAPAQGDPAPSEWQDVQAGASPSSAGEIAKTGAIAGGVGALTGLTGWGAGRAVNMAFPGMTDKSSLTNGITNLDSAIKRSDSTMSLQKLFSEYMGDVVQSGKGLTFADWIGQHGDYNTLSETVKDALAHSGKEVPVIRDMKARDMGSRERVLSDLSSTLGVPRNDLNVTLEQLKADKAKAAEPLYAEAFKDKNPIRDTRLYELFGTDTPNMAMMNALKERLKTLSLQGKEPPTLFATDPSRADAWKRLQYSEVPEHLFKDQEWNKLRELYAPGIEDLHEMRRELWKQRTTAMRAGDTTKADAYHEAWSKLTDFMDNHTSGAYQAARSKYAGDSAVERAAELGGNLLREKPEAIRKALLTMSSEERTALAQGFYGNVSHLYDTKGVRGVSDLLKAEEARNALSAVYTDSTRRDEFIAKLHAEAAMRNSLKEYTGRAVSTNPSSLMHRGAAAIAGVTGHPMSMLYHGAHLGRGEPSRGVSEAITDLAFEEPRFTKSGNGVFPAWYGDAERGLARTLRSIPKSRWTTIPAALGALGTAGVVGNRQGWLAPRGDASGASPLAEQAGVVQP